DVGAAGLGQGAGLGVAVGLHAGAGALAHVLRVAGAPDVEGGLEGVGEVGRQHPVVAAAGAEEAGLLEVGDGARAADVVGEDEELGLHPHVLHDRGHGGVDLAGVVGRGRAVAAAVAGGAQAVVGGRVAEEVVAVVDERLHLAPGLLAVAGLGDGAEAAVQAALDQLGIGDGEDAVDAGVAEIVVDDRERGGLVAAPGGHALDLVAARGRAAARAAAAAAATHGAAGAGAAAAAHGAAGAGLARGAALAAGVAGAARAARG